MKRLAITKLAATLILTVVFTYPPSQAHTQQGDQSTTDIPTINWFLNITGFLDARGIAWQKGQRFTLRCAPSPGTRVENTRDVWGTDVYTSGSSICGAALHAGLITVASGGVVTIEILPSQPSHPASTRNGVTSRYYVVSFFSFVFVSSGIGNSVISVPSAESAQVSSVRFMESDARDESSLREILFARPFFIEAVYTAAPVEREVVVQVDRGRGYGSPVPVTLRPSANNPKVLRSGALYVPDQPMPPDLVPPGATEFPAMSEDTLKASLGGKTAEVRVQPHAFVVAIGFRDHLGNVLPEKVVNGQLKAGEIGAGEPFVAFIQYEAGPNHDEQPVEMYLGYQGRDLYAKRSDEDPFLYLLDSVTVRKPKQLISVFAHGESGALFITEPKIDISVCRPGQQRARDSIGSLTTDEAFFINVFVPFERARTLGDTIVVKLETKLKGASTSLRLSRNSGQRGAVEYTHQQAASLAHGGRGEGRSMHWIDDGLVPDSLQDLFGNYDMGKLKSEKVDTLVVSYSDASVEIPVYWSSIQQTIAEVSAAMNVLRGFYAAGLGKPGVTRAGRETLNRKLALIKNFDQVMAYGGKDLDLDDFKKAIIARTYFDLLQGDPATGWDDEALGPTNWRGVHNRTLGIVYTSKAEGEMFFRMEGTLDEAYKRRLLTGMRDATVGAYQVITTTTGAGQAVTLFTGKDAMGRRVDKTQRFLAGVDLVSQLAMMGAGSLKANQLAKQGAGGLDRARMAGLVRDEVGYFPARDVLLKAPPPRAPRIGRGPSSRTTDNADFRARTTEPVADDFRSRTTAATSDDFRSRTTEAANDAPVNLDADRLTVSDLRAARSTATKDLLGKMGVTSDDVAKAAEKEILAGRSVKQAATVVARENGVPPDRLMDATGATPSQVASTLDDAARARGITDPVAREGMIRDYLKDRTPPDVDRLVRREPAAVRDAAATFDDVREVRSAATKNLLEKMGVKADRVAQEVESEVRGGRSVRQAATVVAQANGVPADRLMKTAGVTSAEVATTLDDAARARGVTDPRVRERAVRDYLKDQTPPDIGGIVARETPAQRPARPPTMPESLPHSEALAFRPSAYQPLRTVNRVTAASGPRVEPPTLSLKPQEWTAPGNRKYTLGPVSEKPPRPGEEMPGSGTFADVFVIKDGPDPRHVGDVAKVLGKKLDVKRAEIVDGDVKNVYATANEIASDIAYGAELLAEKRILHLRVKEVVYDAENPYIIQERLGSNDTIVSSIKGELNAAQNRAIVDLHDKLGRNGIVLEDGHHKNLFLRDYGSGRYEAGILDTDRLALWNQVPSERLAFILERPLAAPMYGVRSIDFGWEAKNPREFMQKMLEYKGWIQYENGRFVPGKGRMDPKIAGEVFDLSIGTRKPLQ